MSKPFLILLLCALGAVCRCDGQAVITSGMLSQYASAPGTAGGGSDSIMQQSLTNSTTFGDFYNWYQYASAFYASNNITLHGVELFSKTNGAAVTGNVDVRIFDDNAGVPGNALAGGQSLTNTMASFAAAAGGWKSFTNFTCSLASGSCYWIVVRQSAYQSGNGVIGTGLRTSPPNGTRTNILRTDTLPFPNTAILPNFAYAYRLHGQ